MANTYTVTELTPEDPHFGTEALCLSENGLAGGLVYKPATVGTTWLHGGPAQSISVGSSAIFGVNDAGDTVGAFGLMNTPTQHAFLHRAGVLIDLVPIVPDGSRATDINNNGLLVGGFGIGTNARAFLYDSVAHTPPSIIGPLPGLSSSGARAINNAGVVAGQSDDRGFVFSGGGIRDLGPAAFIEDINDVGIVVGSVGKPYPANFHAATCDTNTVTPSMVEIPLPPSGGYIGSHGNGINRNGDVVGTCSTAQSYNAEQCAYIYREEPPIGRVSTDLNTLIPANSGWKLNSASDINDHGQIVGTGKLNGQQRAFLLTPVPFDPLQTAASHLATLVGTIYGGIARDGSGIIFVGGVPIHLGPWGPRVLRQAEEHDILIGLALEQLALTIANPAGQIALRRAALQMVRARIDEVLSSLRDAE